MFTGRKVLAVLNPASGARQGEELADRLSEAVLGHGARGCEVRVTAGPDDAFEWSATCASDGYDLLIAGGGDGTVTAIAHGVIRSRADVPIAVLPLGTGNGLARVLGLPLEPDEALEASARGRLVRLDVLEVVSHDTVSLLFCGAGVDAALNEEADRAEKDRLGFLAYVTATMKAAREARRRRVTVTLDESVLDVRAHSVIAFNATRLAVLGIELGPDATPHDGRMDVSMMRTPGAIPILRKALRLLDRRASRAELTPAVHLKLVAHPPLPVQVDGDPIGETPLELRVSPSAVAFVAPADYEGDRELE